MALVRIFIRFWLFISCIHTLRYFVVYKRVVLDSFGSFFWLCKVMLIHFGLLFIQLYGYTCHVDDYYSKILVFDWSRRERMRGGRTIFFLSLLLSSVRAVFFSLSRFVLFLFFFVTFHNSRAIQLNQCYFKETDSKKRCVLMLMLIFLSCFCLPRLTGERETHSFDSFLTQSDWRHLAVLLSIH